MRNGIPGRFSEIVANFPDQPQQPVSDLETPTAQLPLCAALR